MTESEIRLFHDSFERSVNRDRRFFDLFYDRFLSKSDKVREKFERTDFSRQKRALRLSLLLIMEAVVHKQFDFSILERTAVRHSRAEVDIPPHMYNLWLDALVETVRECDPRFTPETEEVWRNAFQPAIEYIVSRY